MMRELRPTAWRHSVEEAICGHCHWDIKQYVDIFKATFPETTAATRKSFAWYIYDGPLMSPPRRNNPLVRYRRAVYDRLARGTAGRSLGR